MAMFDRDMPRVPAVDVHKTDGAYIIHAELPGMEKHDINVTAQDGVFTIGSMKSPLLIPTDLMHHSTLSRSPSM